MTTQIHRYEVPVDDRDHHIDMTPTSRVLHVAVTDDSTTVEFWAEADDRLRDRRVFRVLGTGHPIPDRAEYCGTAPRTPGGLVWHLYETSHCDLLA